MSDSLQPHGLQPARLPCPWGFSRQEHWNGLPCPPPGGIPNPGIKPSLLSLLHWQGDSLRPGPPGKSPTQALANSTSTINVPKSHPDQYTEVWSWKSQYRLSFLKNECIYFTWRIITLQYWDFFFFFFLPHINMNQPHVSFLDWEPGQARYTEYSRFLSNAKFFHFTLHSPLRWVLLSPMFQNAALWARFFQERWLAIDFSGKVQGQTLCWTWIWEE